MDLRILRTKAKTKTEGTWSIRDGLLLYYSKLYILEAILTESILLQTVIIREAYDQLLIGYPGRTKTRQML